MLRLVVGLVVGLVLVGLVLVLVHRETDLSFYLGKNQGLPDLGKNLGKNQGFLLPSKTLG